MPPTSRRPPRPDAGRAQDIGPGGTERVDDDAWVVCGVSGRRVPVADARQVRLSAGAKVWVSAQYFRDG